MSRSVPTLVGVALIYGTRPKGLFSKQGQCRVARLQFVRLRETYIIVRTPGCSLRQTISRNDATNKKKETRDVSPLQNSKIISRCFKGLFRSL